MNNEDYLKAVEIYTEAINSNDKDNLLNITLISNRAEAYLKLGYFNSALIDCNEILNYLKNSNTNLPNENLYYKTIYRKARAVENIEDLNNNKSNLNEALNLYEKLLNKFSINDNQEEINKITKKLKICKNKLNSYFNIAEMIEEENIIIEQINKNNYNYNTHTKEFKFTDYFNPKIIIKFDKNKGMIYTANDDIMEGELLIIEKPLTYIFSEEYEKFKYELNENLITNNEDDIDENSHIYNILNHKLEKKIDSPLEKNNLINSLSQLYNGNNLEINIEERLKMFKIKDILKIISSNSLLSIRNSNGLDYKDICFGLWIKSSFINHSCLPNSFYFGIGPYLIIKSIKQIKINEEINISYIEPKPFDEREYSLLKWNFKCNCDLCSIESKIHNLDEYSYLVKKILKLKYYLSKNHIVSYSQLKSFFSNDNNKEYLNKFTKWVTNVENKFSKENSGYNYIKFLFYKFYLIVFSYTERKDFCEYLFKNCYEYSKSVSIRESYEILSLENIELEEDLKNEVENLNKILYQI